MTWPAAVKILAGVLLGGGCGLAAHRFIGCSQGACPIWSSPLLSTLYGALLGALVGSSA